TSWLYSRLDGNVIRCVPKLSQADATDDDVMRKLIDTLAADWDMNNAVTWFYTPLMLDWAAGLAPSAVVYDCMDELSKFRFASPRLVEKEEELLSRSDMVFTGGHSLYMAKCDRHRAVYEFASSIDAEHFRKARAIAAEMPEQADLPRLRIGYAGVIDERIDLDLVSDTARMRPEWSFIMLGPVVKIDEASLPKAGNIHYLGMKDYSELPKYFAGWDVGMMPFALNEATEFISPTKTPEYLAAGLPVVSTPIADVVRPYGEMGLVQIAGSAEDFVDSIFFAASGNRERRLAEVDRFLANRSWDKTFRSMDDLIQAVVNQKAGGVRPASGVFAQRADAAA
ncbi:MAG: glycosyltransferase, partial [Pyrinomonadaceae bacterium]|nr:glycosyltransferase [Pyrinomonadaceae bacterium]